MLFLEKKKEVIHPAPFSNMSIFCGGPETIMSVHQSEAGSFFFQAYGARIVYEPKHESVVFYMGDEKQRDITAFFPEKPTMDEFEESAKKYVRCQGC